MRGKVWIVAALALGCSRDGGRAARRGCGSAPPGRRRRNGETCASFPVPAGTYLTMSCAVLATGLAPYAADRWSAMVEAAE